MKNHQIVAVLAFVGLVTLGAIPVFAQSSSRDASEAKKGTPTVVLKFKTMEVSQEIMDAFYLSLNEELNAHDDMHVVSGGEVTIGELSVTVGCNELDPSCLAGLDEYVDAKRMVFGSVERSDDVYLFTVKLFDFEQKRFVRQLAERTVEGDPSVVKRAVPAVVESFLYGDVGTLEVSVSNGEAPRVYFDGEKMGPAPTTLQNLPLGQHAITVKTQDGEEQTKFVMLRKDQPQTVEFSFQGGGELSGGGGGPPVLTISSIGAGVLGSAVGIIGGAQWLKFKAELEPFKGCSDSLCAPEDGMSPTETSAAFQETQAKFKQSAILANVGWGVGAVGFGVGGYLLYRHLAGSGTELNPKALKSLQVTPRRNGVSIGFSSSF